MVDFKLEVSTSKILWVCAEADYLSVLAAYSSYESFSEFLFINLFQLPTICRQQILHYMNYNLNLSGGITYFSHSVSHANTIKMEWTNRDVILYFKIPTPINRPSKWRYLVASSKNFAKSTSSKKHYSSESSPLSLQEKAIIYYLFRLTSNRMAGHTASRFAYYTNSGISDYWICVNCIGLTSYLYITLLLDHVDHISWLDEQDKYYLNIDLCFHHQPFDCLTDRLRLSMNFWCKIQFISSFAWYYIILHVDVNYNRQKIISSIN